MPFPPPQELPDPGSLAGSLSLELLGKSDTLSMPLRRQYSNRYVEVVCLFAEQINNVHAIVQWGNGHRLGRNFWVLMGYCRCQSLLPVKLVDVDAGVENQTSCILLATDVDSLFTS